MTELCHCYISNCHCWRWLILSDPSLRLMHSAKQPTNIAFCFCTQKCHVDIFSVRLKPQPTDDCIPQPSTHDQVASVQPTGSGIVILYSRSITSLYSYRYYRILCNSSSAVVGRVRSTSPRVLSVEIPNRVEPITKKNTEKYFFDSNLQPFHKLIIFHKKWKYLSFNQLNSSAHQLWSKFY